MASPTSFAGWTYNDSTIKPNGEPESGSFQVAITNLTAANVAAQTTLRDNLTTAIDALLLGVLAKTELVFDRVLVSQLPANDQLAQREIKLLLRYEGATTHKKFRTSLPTFDLSTLPLHDEFLDLTSGAGAALKTAWEAFVKSPDDDTEATVLLTAQFVGRNT